MFYVKYDGNVVILQSKTVLICIFFLSKLLLTVYTGILLGKNSEIGQIFQ